MENISLSSFIWLLGFSYVIHLLLRLEIDRRKHIEVYNFNRQPASNFSNNAFNVYRGFLFIISFLTVLPILMLEINNHLENKSNERYLLEHKHRK